jgi:hypothetical protein
VSGLLFFARDQKPKALSTYVSGILARGCSRPSPTSLPDPRTVVWVRFPQHVTLQSSRSFTAFRNVEPYVQLVLYVPKDVDIQPNLHYICASLIFSGIQIADESLCGAPFVAMMQPTDLRDFDHLA